MLKGPILRSTLVAFVCSVSVAVHAMADPNVQVNVPAGELSTALAMLAKQTGAEFVYQADQVRGLHTNGVTGNYSAPDAVRILLKDTSLELRVDPSGAMLIAAHRALTAGDPQKTGSNATPKEGKTGSSHDFRVAQVDQATVGPAGVESENKEKKPILEEVIVTGSRIPMVAGQEALPVREYSSDDIARSGQGTVANFLNTLPDVSFANPDFGLGTSVGQSTVQLHGLPIGSTLVLLDGQRLETSYFSFFDLNNIPLSAVERIDVLPVGSSAIYGSDGLAGAVNIILRRRVDGLEFNGKYGYADGYNDKTADLSWGASSDRGAISLVGNFRHVSGLVGAERTVTSTTNFPANAPTFVDETDACNPGNVYSLDGQPLPGLGGATFAAIPSGLSGKPTVEDFLGTAGKLNTCNSSLYNRTIPESSRGGVLLAADYQAMSSVDVFLQILYSHQSVDAAMPLINLFGGSFGEFTLAAGNAFNPFGKDVGVSYVYPGINGEFGLTGEFVRPLVGLRGQLGSSWSYEVNGYWSHDRADFPATGLAPNPTVLAALASSDPTTAFNPFTAGAPGSPLLMRSLVASAASSPSTLTNQASVATAFVRGPIAQLPGGPLKSALGVEYTRSEQRSSLPSTGTDLNLSRTGYAVFAELRAPFVAGRVPQSGDMLALTAAARFDHSSDFGGKTTFQSGLEWRPVDALLFRGAYSQAYQAPQLFQLSGGTSLSSTTAGAGIVDPFRGNESVAVPYINAANPNLRAETGRSYTFGVVYGNPIQSGFAASAAYFDVEINDYIGIPAIQVAIDNPSLYPSAVVRAPPTAQDIQNGYPGRITEINDLYFNFGKIHVAGVDFDVSHRLDSPAGQFVPALAISAITKWQSALVPGSASVSYLNQESLASPGFAPKWKGSVGLNWNRGAYSASVTGRYIGRYKDYQDFVPNSNELGNDWYLDVNLHCDVARVLGSQSKWLAGSYVEFGGINVLNELPSYSYGVLFDAREADLLGRLLYLRVGGKW